MTDWTIPRSAPCSPCCCSSRRGAICARRTIPNGLNAAIASLAPLWWWAHGLPLWPDVAWQIGLAAVVFALFAGAFALGMMGGGDVKMIGALALWLPPWRLGRDARA